MLDASISEKKNLQFQEHFFDALTQKSIKNYELAITSLEEANSIIPNEKAVLFELSKNYLILKKTTVAKEYINEALDIDASNVWLLEHLVAIQKREGNYDDAIVTQYKIVENYPKKKKQIVYLHLKNKDNKGALKVIDELAEAKMLDARLRRIQKNLTKPKVTTTANKTVSETTVKGSLKDEFLNNKSYDNLKKLLEQLDTQKSTELLEFSKKGMGMFPAQPLVYLMNGKAYNRQKEFKKGLTSLQNGIDFVIDDTSLEKQFYAQMVIAYKSLGDVKNVSKYQKKL